MIDPDIAIHEIGAKGHFSKALAWEAATGFSLAISVHPSIPHMLCVAGYDDDDRQLWDIPEARDFIKDFVGFVALTLPGRPIGQWSLDEPSLALLLVCSGLGRIKGRNPDTGAYIIERCARPPAPTPE